MDFARLMCDAKAGDGKPSKTKIKTKTVPTTSKRAEVPKNDARNGHILRNYSHPSATGSSPVESKDSKAIAHAGATTPLEKVVSPKETACTVEPTSTRQTTSAKVSSVVKESTAEIKVVPAKDTAPTEAIVPAHETRDAEKRTQHAKELPSPKKKATAKPLVPPSEGYMSLELLKRNAMATIKMRHQTLVDGHSAMFAVIRETKGAKFKEAIESALEPAMKILAAERDALEADLNKLKSFGNGFDLANIKRIDAQAIGALSSWGSATVNQSTSVSQKPSAKALPNAPAKAATGAAAKVPAKAKAPAKDLAKVRDKVYLPPRNIAAKVAPRVRTTSDEKVAQGSVLSKNLEKQHAVSRATNATSVNTSSVQHALPSPSPSVQPASKPVRKSSALMPPKRTGSTSTMSRTRQNILAAPERATSSNIVGIAEAFRVEAKAKDARSGGWSSMGKPKTRLSSKDGELRIRKNVWSVAGEKRKRGDVMEHPNKRSAIEGRNFKPLRTRREMPSSSKMDIDSFPIPSATVASLNF